MGERISRYHLGSPRPRGRRLIEYVRLQRRYPGSLSGAPGPGYWPDGVGPEAVTSSPRLLGSHVPPAIRRRLPPSRLARDLQRGYSRFRIASGEIVLSFSEECQGRDGYLVLGISAIPSAACLGTLALTPRCVRT